MSRVTKAQQIENLEAEVERLSDDLIKAEDERQNLIARAIQRNSDYEAEIRDLHNGINELSEVALDAAEKLRDQVADARSRAQFLAQGLVAICSYGGNDVNVVLDLAGALVQDWIPGEEV